MCLLEVGEPHRRLVFEPWTGLPQRAACNRLLGQLNPLICQWVISGTHTSKATEGQTNVQCTTKSIFKQTYSMSAPLLHRVHTAATGDTFKWNSKEYLRELLWYQSCECNWGLNAPLTVGNRSRPLFPSYRNRQRLSVFMSWVRACQDMSTSYNLYERLVSRRQNNTNPLPLTCTWYNWA